MRLRIVECPHQGAVIWAIASLRTDMLRLTRTMLRALGVEDNQIEIEIEEEERPVGPSAREVVSVVVDPDLVGRRAIATVVHNSWEGEMRPKVRSLRRAA